MVGYSRIEPVLLVQSTGSGKSSVPLTLLVVEGGVIIIIEDTLALGSDQVLKVNNRTFNYGKQVKTYHLDIYESKEHQDGLCKAIWSHCQPNEVTPILIFTTPETLLKRCWVKLVYKLVQNSTLWLFCIDEIHLFIEFLLSYRKEFVCLNNKIMKLIKCEEGTSKVPLILVTYLKWWSKY